jgi:hypothetical protein
MKKTLRMTIDVVVEDMSEADRREIWEGMCLVPGEDELEDINDFSAYGIADAVAAFLNEDTSNDILEGSDYVVSLVAADVFEAEWVSDAEGEPARRKFGDDE